MSSKEIFQIEQNNEQIEWSLDCYRYNGLLNASAY